MSLSNDVPLNRTERRKQETRNRLKRAAWEILATEGYGACSITAVTRRADLGYGTFYVHFEDIDSILWAVLYDYFEQLRAAADQEVGDLPSPLKEYRSWVIVFEHALQTREAFLALISDKGRGILSSQIQAYFADVYLRNLEAGTYSVPAPIAALPLEAVAHTITGAQIHLMNWWLRDPGLYSAEQVAAMLYQFTFHEPPPDMQ